MNFYKKYYISNILKELLIIANKIRNPLYNSFNTPVSRSRAESFARGSSYEMLSKHEIENLELVLAELGF